MLSIYKFANTYYLENCYFFSLVKYRNSIRSRSLIKLKWLLSRSRFWILCNTRASELQTNIQVLRPNRIYERMTVYVTTERGI